MRPLHVQENAFKTALAITLAYAVALALNWEEPIWAAFGAHSILHGVIYAGMTLHKGLMRFGAAIAGGCLAAAIIGLTVQNYWLSLAFISVATGVWFFLARRSTDAYGFSQAGHVGYVVWASVLFEPQHTFAVASYRISETCLGIVIGILVAYMVWPRLEFPVIRQKMVLLRRSLIQLCKQSAGAACGDVNAEKMLRATESQLIMLLDEIEVLCVAANRTASFRSDIELPYTVFLKARILAEHFSALLSLLKQNPQHVDSNLAIAVSGWLGACAVQLERMDWERNSIEPDAGTEAPSIDLFRNQIDLGVMDAVDHPAFEAGSATLAIAVRGQLELITNTIAQLARRFTENAAQPRDQSTDKVEIEANAGRLETVSTDLKHSIAAASALFAAGMFWFSIYIPAGSSVVQWAGILQLGLVSLWFLPYRMLMVSIVVGMAMGFSVAFLVLPRLDGVLELSIVFFVGSYALLFVFYGNPIPVLIFLAMLMVKEQQGNFNTLLQPWLNAAIAIIVGLHISLGVTMLLIPANPRRRLCDVVRQLLSCASGVLHDIQDQKQQRIPENRLQRERKRLSTACKRLARCSSQAASLEKKPLADAINRVAYELQVTAGTLLALESCRIACAKELTNQDRENELRWRNAVILTIHTTRDSMETDRESPVDFESLIRHVDDSASRRLQSAGAGSVFLADPILSLMGHYRVVCAALASLAAAFRQCDFEKLMENRF